VIGLIDISEFGGDITDMFSRRDKEHFVVRLDDGGAFWNDRVAETSKNSGNPGIDSRHVLANFLQLSTNDGAPLYRSDGYKTNAALCEIKDL
jgi:hypothetical protein